MRIRKRTLGILAALGIAASTLIAPQVNAATLTIEDRVCTLTPSAVEGDRLVAYHVEWSRNLLTELKNEVPAARSDIDYVVNNALLAEDNPDIATALNRIITASLDEGFWNVNNDPEAVAVIFMSMGLEELAPRFRDAQVFNRDTIPLNPQDPSSPIDDPSIPISPALQRLFQNAVPSNAGAITDWQIETYAACRNGVPGTYNIGGGGGGGGGNGGGGSSFGSS